jgi:hypothetical protein
MGGRVRLSAIVLGLLRASASLWATLPLSLPEPNPVVVIEPGFWWFLSFYRWGKSKNQNKALNSYFQILLISFI